MGSSSFAVEEASLLLFLLNLNFRAILTTFRGYEILNGGIKFLNGDSAVRDNLDVKF